ncbi:DUF2577 domain-containing protein [Lysinibacillus fusiformis]|uniref:DUF2577 domain-containing protein n=1 Tax=Lysinibacillus fusiformis TaxID=28031 RepID=UPI002D782701|nr:DUF2577 domain-containing protein [Lysinibacillus fusiformis]WRT00267.1 DUF2577 domain-containing protein [Lysinibacillus fusiformis]
MEDILKEIQKLVLGVINAQKLSTVVYGTVLSVSPLEIHVDQKITLKEEQLKLTRAVVDYEVDMTIEHETEMTDLHTHENKGRKKFKIHNGLMEGDKVTMIRAHGGQQFLIIDKEVV